MLIQSCCMTNRLLQVSDREYRATLNGTEYWLGRAEEMMAEGRGQEVRLAVHAAIGASSSLCNIPHGIALAGTAAQAPRGTA